MTDILLSIGCSSIIMLVFKLVGKKGIPVFPIIVLNYFVCVSIALLTIEKSEALIKLDLASDASWFALLTALPSQSWFPIAVIMSFLFISGFFLMAISTQKAGMGTTVVANKLAMAIPVVIAFLFYGEAMHFWLITGLLLAIPAVGLASYQPSERREKYFLLFPVGVWLTGGAVDSLLNYAQEFYLQSDQFAFFLIIVFGGAGAIGLCIHLLNSLRLQQSPFSWRIVCWGLVLGIPNYGSMFFLLRALEESGLAASSVFPLNNIGIVLISSLIGFGIFKEHLNRYNAIGLVLAILVIAMIGFSS